MFNKFKNTWFSNQSPQTQVTKRAQGGIIPEDAIDPNAVLNDENYGAFVQEILDAHNYFRDLHGVPPLELKDEVSAYSQNWADTLANEKVMKHSKPSDRPNYGENIYYFSGKYIPGNFVVESWYSEAKTHKYKYGQEPKDIMKIGHFSQVVWKESTYLGVGATVWEKGLFVVCNYEPPGNVRGQFTENVPAPVE